MKKQLIALTAAATLATTLGTATVTLAGPREVRRSVYHVLRGKGEIKDLKFGKHTFNVRRHTRIYHERGQKCIDWDYSHRLRFRTDDKIYVTACGLGGKITKLEQKIKRGGILATLRLAANPLSVIGVPFVDRLPSIEGVYHTVTGQLRRLQGTKWETEAAGFNTAVATEFVRRYARAPSRR
jgi:hypothetical protein